MVALVKLQHGFDLEVPLANRFYRALSERSHHLMIRGVAPTEIDLAITEFGFQMGPLESEDLTGLEKAWQQRKFSGIDRKSRAYLSSGLMISDRMVQEGRLGKISGVGWYRYPGGKGKVEDPLLEDLIREEAYFAGIEQISFSTDEILMSLLDALREEVCAAMERDAELTLDIIDRIFVDTMGYSVDETSVTEKLGLRQTA